MSEAAGVRPTFNELMSEAVILHNQGGHERALARREWALDVAEPGTLDQGRAAREIAASNLRLGRVDEAFDWATTAYEIHDASVSQELPASSAVPASNTKLRAAFRERGASAIYVAAAAAQVRLSSGSSEDVSSPDPVDYARRSLVDFYQACRLAKGGLNRYVDQYRINNNRRASVIESLYGDRKHGAWLALGAVAMAPLSESPRLDTTNPDMTRKARLATKLRAGALATGALGIAAITTRKPSARRVFSQRLAQYIL